MNYTHVSFIRNVMNAESRSKALSASVLLKELVSRNFRILLCTSPREPWLLGTKHFRLLSQRWLWLYQAAEEGKGQREIEFQRFVNITQIPGNRD